MDNSTFYLALFVASAPGIVTLIVSFVKWMGQRAVDREDQDKEETRIRLKEHDERFGRVEKSIDELKASNERRFGEVEKSLMQIQLEMKHVASNVDSLHGGINELKVGLDNRFEKQSAFYKTSLTDQTLALTMKMEKMEQDLRQDMSRAMADTFKGSDRRKK
jgi:hypothetical protein